MDLYRTTNHVQRVQWMPSLLHSVLDSIGLFGSSILDFRSASAEFMFMDGFTVG